MKLSDILFEGAGDFDVKVRMSGADLQNIPDSLTYVVSDVVMETKKGAIRVPKGGTLNLNITPNELAKKVAEATDFNAEEVVNIELKDGLSDFKLNSDKVKYVMTVEYVDKDGNRETLDLPFTAMEFNPSDQFIEGLSKLS